MKPIRLVMSAFGSYGKTEEIDFSNVKEGLFLITGDTGAGKTTIFDAVMYALYGRTSGGERNGGMMRSQFALPGAKTYVCYRFSYGGEIYEITRNPEYTIEKELKNGKTRSQKVPQNVELLLPEGSIFPGKKAETDAKIEEIIGLSAEQFTQMAMIAQGDFLKLIYAKTDERKKIFTKLFGTGLYTRIEEKIKNCSNEMDVKIKENRRAMEQEYARKIVPDGMIQIEEAAVSDVLQQYLSYGKEREREMKMESTVQKNLADSIQEQITKAKEALKLFEALESANQKQENLNRKTGDIEKIKEKIERGKQAENVRRIEQQMEETNQAVKKNIQVQKELEEAEGELSKSLQVFRQVKQWILLKKKEAIFQDIKTSLRQYEKKQKELYERKVVWKEVTEESILCSREYDEKYVCFLREQAGILAEGLKEQMPCPVCGSKEHPNPAKLSEEAVSEEQVNQAKKRREEAEKQRQEAENAYRILEEQQKFRWKDLKAEIEKHTGELCGDGDEAESKLKEACVVCEQEMQTCYEAWKENDEWQEFCRRFSKEIEQQKLPEIRQRFYEDIVGEAEQKHQTMLAEKNQKQGERLSKQKEQKELEEKAFQETKQYGQALKAAGFENEEEYRNCVLSVKEQERLSNGIADFESQFQKNAGQIQGLKEQIRGKKKIPIEQKQEELKEIRQRQQLLEKQKQEYHTANSTNEAVWKNIKAYEEEYMRLQKEDAVIKSLYRTANGRLTQSAKMDLETYVQRQYFRQIIGQANKRFLVMTNQQFMLQLKDEITGKGKNEGLDLLVYSLVTGSSRDIKTLSGGESFLAALSMALGLSDIVKRNAGGIHLDMMFIDEGFGSLDEESRRKAVEVLDELSGGKRLIGIISHVTELKEQLDRKLIVTRNEKGSSVCWENS